VLHRNAAKLLMTAQKYVMWC